MKTKQFLFLVLFLIPVINSCTPVDPVKTDTPNPPISYTLSDSSAIIVNHPVGYSTTAGDGISWDSITGVIIVSKQFASQAGYSFKENSILCCDLDTMGLIRRILTIDSTSVDYILHTDTATMEDLFTDLEANFSTEPSSEILTSTNLGLEAISKALTDENQVIHPYKIINYAQDETVLSVWSAAEPIPENLGSSVAFDVTHSFTDLMMFDYSKENVAASLKVTYGSISLSDKTSIGISIKANIDLKGIHTHVKKFTCSNSSSYSIATDLELNTNAKFDYKRSFHIAKIYSKRFCFLVGVVPVWITVKTNLYGYASASTTGSMKATTSLTYKIDNCDFGVAYKDGDWSNTHGCSIKFTKGPLKVTGDANLTARIEIYPRIDVDLYDVAGPYLELVPFMDAYNDYSFDAVVGGNNNQYWQSTFNAGLDLRMGAQVKVLGHKLAEYSPSAIHLLSPYNIYKAPATISIVSGDKQTGKKGKQLTNDVTVRVYDSFGDALALAPVYFEPSSEEDGTTGDHWKLTDSKGLCSTTWTLGSNSTNQKLNVSIKSNKSTTIKSQIFEATASIF